MAYRHSVEHALGHLALDDVAGDDPVHELVAVLEGVGGGVLGGRGDHGAEGGGRGHEHHYVICSWCIVHSDGKGIFWVKGSVFFVVKIYISSFSPPLKCNSLNKTRTEPLTQKIT